MHRFNSLRYYCLWLCTSYHVHKELVESVSGNESMIIRRESEWEGHLVRVDLLWETAWGGKWVTFAFVDERKWKTTVRKSWLMSREETSLSAFLRDIKNYSI